MPQRKTVFADILRKPAQTEEAASATGGTKKPKVNKATDPGYMKLTAYIPRDLHFQIKAAMIEDEEIDQSAYLERWLREKLRDRQSATASKRSRATV